MYRLQGCLGALPTRRLWHAMTGALALVVAAAGAVNADVDEKTLHLTPARIGYVEGEVSFWRPGAGDWEAATVNIPLAAGDALATRDGRFELQIGPQAFLRASDQTQLTVKSQEPDFLQLEMNQGSTVLDLRQLPPGHVVQITTPQGAMTANSDGFYRVDVGADSTRVTVRRAGIASLTPVGGQPLQVATGESVTLSGGAAGQLNVVAAPAFDEWDRWNYARADAALAVPRSAAVATEVYGAADLDRYGGWRYVPTYGRVWVPYSVPVGWAPYTTGRWLWDPVYGYSWVDYAPWGWAPYHYGRWVYNGYWAWAPGPVVFGAAVYAPALVSFFTPAVSVSIGIGVPFIGWTALSWGEPLVPWWGGVGFVGVPCWYGWGGPRVVNNIVINNYDTVNANQINMYRNARVPGGLVGVPKNQFGGPDVQRVRLASLASNDVKPLRSVTRTALGGPAGLQAAGKSGLPALSADRAGAAGFRGAGAQFSRQGAATAGPAGGASAPRFGAEGAAFDRLRGGNVQASREPLPKSGIPGLENRSAAAAPAAKGSAAPFDRLRGATAPGQAVPKQSVPSVGDRSSGSVSAAGKGVPSAPFDRLRSSPGAGTQPVPKQALPSLSRSPSGGAATNGAAKAPSAPFDRLGTMSRQPVPKQSAAAYRRLQGGTVSAGRAPIAPSYSRGVQRAPVAKAPAPSFASRAPAPAVSNWSRVQQPGVSAARPRALARVDRAPTATFAPQAKPLAMPNVSRGSSSSPSLGGGSLGGGTIGGGSLGGGSLGAGGGGIGRGGGGGGGRPNFSR